MEIIIVALIAGVLGPTVLAFITGIQRARDDRRAADIRREERLEDYARQDAVAAQAEKAVNLLQESQAKIADVAHTTNGKLDVIHTLVNSNMTAAMQAELDATVRELALMHEIIEMKRKVGSEPMADSISALALTEARIIELQNNLNDRNRQNK